jgi:hypothetical protein
MKPLRTQVFPKRIIIYPGTSVDLTFCPLKNIPSSLIFKPVEAVPAFCMGERPASGPFIPGNTFYWTIGSSSLITV